MQSYMPTVEEVKTTEHRLQKVTCSCGGILNPRPAWLMGPEIEKGLNLDFSTL